MAEMLDFEKGNLNKLFIKFAIPSIVGLLMISMMVIIDGLFVSMALGPLGLAAVNLSMPVMNVVMSVGLMIACGGVVIAGIAKGNKNEKLAKGYTTLTLVVLAVTLLVISAIILLNIDSICRLLGANGDIFHYVKSYLMILIAGSFFYCAPVFTETFCRLANKPKLVYVSGAVGLITNVVLDYIFILKLNWGMEGAAYATIVAAACSTFALLPYVEFGKMMGTMKDVRKIFFNGSSEMLVTMSSAVTAYVFNIVLLSNLGTIGVSALTIVLYVNMLVNFSLFGLAQSLQPLVAYNVGAMNYMNIKKLLRISLIMGGCIGWFTYIAFQFGKDAIIKIFTGGNEELYMLAKTAAMYITIHYLFSFVNIIASSFHTAIEKPLESAFIGLCRSIVFVLIPLFVLPTFLGEIGIWISVPVGEILCLCVSIPLMIISMRKLKAKMNVA